jgi:hypothetical protein
VQKDDAEDRESSDDVDRIEARDHRLALRSGRLHQPLIEVDTQQRKSQSGCGDHELLDCNLQVWPIA